MHRLSEPACCRNVRFRSSDCQGKFGKLALLAVALLMIVDVAVAGGLKAGVAKVDISDYDAGPLNDPLYVKALVLKSNDATAVLISVDAVAIGEIGRISNDYLPQVRGEIEKQLGIPSRHVLINASHCHGVVCADIGPRTVQAVKTAASQLVPVKVGAGTGHENRIMENRRLGLKSGRQADVRHAYSLPLEDAVVAVGPIDPEIGILRLDRETGGTLAVVYNFACHPIQGVPSGANTADIIGYASKVIEENLSEGTLAIFLQGCGGDINPVNYKVVDQPRSAEPLGNLLGLSTLRGIRGIRCNDDSRLKIVSETIELPRRDQTERIRTLDAEQQRLVNSFRGTSLNFKTFLPLMVKYSVEEEFPSNYSYAYRQQQAIGADDLKRLDAENRRNLQAYLKNIDTMEELTRVQTNLALLKKHQAQLVAAGKRTVDVELGAIRVGDFVLTTFPGELTVRIGLNIKQAAPAPQTFVAGYTNGYIYYAPTTEQLLNPGSAQEDCDCILAPEWQPIYEKAAAKLLGEVQN